MLIDDGDAAHVRNPWRSYVVPWGEVGAIVGRQPNILKGAVCPALRRNGHRGALTICGLACFGRLFSGRTSQRDEAIIEKIRTLADRHSVPVEEFLRYLR